MRANLDAQRLERRRERSHWDGSRVLDVLNYERLHRIMRACEEKEMEGWEGL